MDRRIRYTKQVIKETFIKLLSEKDISKISVSEICKLADINRATFYRYYLDIYDLLEKIEKELIDELKTSYTQENSSKYSVSSFSSSLLNVFLKNKELIKILFNTNNNIYFLNDILEVAYEKCYEKWSKDIPNISETEIEYASTYIFNGALGIINFWVKNDFDKNVDEISEIIENLSYHGIQKYIYNKKEVNLV